MDEDEHTVYYIKAHQNGKGNSSASKVLVRWISNFMDNLGMFSLSGRCFRKEKEEVVAKVEQG